MEYCSKIYKCLELEIYYIIDDDKTCINVASNGIKALYFNNNALIYLEENSNLKNVHNWGKVYKYLMLGEEKLEQK